MRDGGSSYPGLITLEGKPLMSTDELESEAVCFGERRVRRAGARAPRRRSASSRSAVDITDVGPCKKHLKITIPRDEIDRQYEESLENLRKEAVVPGFRPGRAPRQLVVKRFRKQVSDQVKSNLLMSSLEQIDKDYKLEPITQPRLDVEAIEIPDKGPMNFEMDVEVRPQFEVPNYKGLKVKRPGRRAHREGRRRAAHALPRSATARSCPSWKGPPSSAIISRPTWSSFARTGSP